MARAVKGQGGAPGGRPGPGPEISALAQQHGARALERLAEWMESDNARDSLTACQALLDRSYGKPTQPLAGDDGKPPAPMPETPSVEALAKLSPQDRADIRSILGRALGRPDGDGEGA